MNTFYFTQRFSARVFTVIALFSLLAGMLPTQAFAIVAAPGSPYGASTIDKVDICHATGSGSFTSNNVSVTSSGAPQGGHDHHNSDIIPSYFYKDGNNQTQFYASPHWTVSNAIIWNGGACNGASLTVTKIVSGGAKVPNDFNLKIGSAPVLSGVTKTVAAGTYTVSEMNQANYTAGTWGGDCAANGSVTLAAGQTKSCTITNTYVPPPTPCVAPYTGFQPNCVLPPSPVPGCTNPAATNYNPNATIDDGSCVLPVPGCTDQAANNYNSNATVNNGSCTYDVPGCTNPAATNYNPAANVDNGSCVLPVPGCTDQAANNYNSNATVNNGSCTYDPTPVLGCTNPAATNYNPLATEGDGSCQTGGGGTDPVPGCMDETAVNYDVKATTDNDSCIYDYVSQCNVEAANLLVNGSFEDNVVDT